MAKVFRAVGTVAKVAALVLTVAGNPAGAAIASLVAAGAEVGAALTTKRPPARGAVNSIVVAAEPPAPYLMGRTYTGGILRHDTAWGGKVGKVQNPYRGMVTTYSVAGPVDALEDLYFDFEPIPATAGAATGYYAGFLYYDSQLGATPEGTALASYGPWGAMPGWGASSGLSGKAAVLWNLKFDKDGKRFASGVPQMGAVWRGVKVYDPRLDSTYPGGSGSQRINNESTWAYSDTPALHALTYAYGRHYDGKRLFGIGLGVDGIDIASFVAGANVEEANGWTLGGVIYEPGDRWDNLKNICAAGSAEPVFAGGKLSYKQDAPRVSIGTITNDTLGEGPVTVRAMQSYRDRLNTIVPKYRSENHKWEYVAAEAVSVTSYVTEDGEVKTEEIQWNLVQDKDQAAQLAAYRLVNGRELAIELTLKPEARFWQPGDLLTIDLPEAALNDVDAVLISRTIDPTTLQVTATFVGETAAKHDFALGRTGVAPPTPSLVSPETLDDAASVNAPRAPFVQDTEPPIADSIEGDEWYDSDDGFRHYVFNGTAWVTTAATPGDATQTVLVTGQNATSGTILLSLGDGASRAVEAAIRVTGLSGSCTQTIKIQSRLAGGTWADLGSAANDSGNTGDTVFPIASATLTNGTGLTQTYELRAVTSTTGTGTGTVDQPASYLRA